MNCHSVLIRSNPASGGSRTFPVALTILLAAFLFFAAGATCQVQFTTVAYDGFNYSAGSLSGQNGGTGWTTAWTRDYSAGGSLNVSATGLSYSGLSTTGGSLVWGSGGNGISEDSRTLSLQNSGVVYLQFLCQFGSSSGGGTPNIRLYNSGTFTGGFGANGGTYGSTISILDNTLNPASDGSSSSSASLSSLNFVVARIDYQTAMTTLWVNPNLSTFNYQNPTSPDASYAGLAPAFDKISIYTRSPAQLDEVKVMSQPVPEPAPAMLFVLGIAGILWNWWQRHQTNLR